MLLKNPKIALASAALLTAILSICIRSNGLLADIVLRLPGSSGNLGVSFVFLPLIVVLLSLPGFLLMMKSIRQSLLISVLAALEAYWIAYALVGALFESYNAWLAMYGMLILLSYVVATLFFRDLLGLRRPRLLRQRWSLASQQSLLIASARFFSGS